MRLVACSSLALAPLLLVIAGCGGAASPPATSPPTPHPSPYTVAGNWVLAAEAGSGVLPLQAQFLGALSLAPDATVTGVFRIPRQVPDSPCVSPTQDIHVSGTVDATGLLTLTSEPFSGSVATLVLQLVLPSPSRPVPSPRGTIVIAGGACALASSTLFGIEVASVTGTYTGTLAPPQFLGQPPTNAGGPATITLSQSAANADGQFPVSAVVVFTSPSCTLSTTLSGIVTGLSITLRSSTASGPLLLPDVTLSGLLPIGNSTTLTPVLAVSPSAPTCANGLYSGELTRP